MAARESADSSEQVLDSPDDVIGRLSYIKLGRPRTHGGSSSPTISNTTGQYVWDFLNWGLTTRHTLEAFAEVKANETDLVPFSDMDQGRLFVRVSIQDLATLQMGYQSGLAALHRIKSRVEQLKEENSRLESMMEHWSTKSSRLSMETAELRQEICRLKREIRGNGCISIDEHNELLSILCSNICELYKDGSSFASYNTSSDAMFHQLLKLVFSLPPLLHERLANACPSFNMFVNSKGSPSSLVAMQLIDAKTSIQKVLGLLPTEFEHTLLDHLVRTFNNKQSQDSKYRALSVPITRQDELKSYGSSNVLPSTVIYDEAPLEKDKVKQSFNLSQSEDTKCDGTSAIERLNSLMTARLDHNEGDKNICERCENQEPSAENVGVIERRSKSQSSGFGTPLAHSTPMGTLAHLVSTKNHLNPKRSRKRKKRKVSRWNFAARFCSSKRSATISDSESIESSLYLQATRPQVIRQHGIQTHQRKGYKWLFKNRNKEQCRQ